MPTREAWTKDYIVEAPDNLVVRFSIPMVDQAAIDSWPHTSTVSTNEASMSNLPGAHFRAIKCKDCQSLLGQISFKMFATVNTKKFPRGILDQVISLTRKLAYGGRARAPGPGLKLQASSCKRQAFEPTCSSIKRQASSPRQQASSSKPEANKLPDILDPRNMDIGEVLEEQGPRVFAKINVLLRMTYMVRNLVWTKPKFFTLRYLKLYSTKVPRSIIDQ